MEGDKRKKSKLKIVVVLAVVVVALLAIGSCGGSQTDGTDTGAASANGGAKQEAKAPKYTVEGEELVDKGYGMYAITGVLTNNSGSDRDYVQVEYVVKDADGVQIGTALANTNNLADGGSWKYEACILDTLDEAPASYELVEASGF